MSWGGCAVYVGSPNSDLLVAIYEALWHFFGQRLFVWVQSLTWGHTQELLGTFDSPMLCTIAIAAMSGTCKADV